MSEYFEYLRLMLEAFFKDFGIFFKDVFASPWDKVGSNVSHYNELFATYSANFGFWGWFFFVLFILIFTAFIGGLCFLIFLGLYFISLVNSYFLPTTYILLIIF